MHKHLSLAAVSLLLTLQASPILTHAQVVTVTEDYHPIYTDAVRINFTNGNYASDPNYDATQQVLIKNDSINVDVTKFHYIHFWDSTNNYLGYFKTAKGVNTSGSYLGELTTSDVPLPLGAYSFAVERFDNLDFDYDVTNGISLSELFNEGQVYNLVGKAGFNYIIYDNQDLISLFENNITLIPILGDNMDFSNGTTSWTEHDTTLSASNGILSIKALGNVSTPYTSQYIYNESYINNVYYVQYRSRVTNSDAIRLVVRFNMTQTIDIINEAPVMNQWYNTTQIITANGTGDIRILPYHEYSSPLIAKDKVMEIDFIQFVNLTQLVNKGIITTPTQLAYENWITTYTNYNINNYYGSIEGSEITSGTWFNYHQLWQNQTVAGLETIDQQYYLNGDRKYIFDLTALFGAGNEPVLATIQGWLADFDILISYNWVSHTAFVNQAITYDVSYWDDQVGESVTNGFILVMSGAVTFILMFLGFKTRAKLFNLLAIPGAIWFTIQGGASLPIILVGFGLVIMNALFFAKVD